MKSLASAEERKLLDKTLKLVNAKSITTTEAWGLFTYPKQTDVLTALGVLLSEEDISHLKNLKSKVVKHLKEKSRKRCAYCRRPMGTHAMSWHIEHIKPKSRFPSLMFSLENLVYACIDCNFTKNNQIDNKKHYVFDIINPAMGGFDYSKHISYYQLTTDHLHLVKYDPVSKEGRNTYIKLFLNRIEALEVVMDLNSGIRNLAHRIDEAVDDMVRAEGTQDLAEFLTRLKLEMAMPKNGLK